MTDLVVAAPGVLRFDGRSFHCALGRGGVSADKREGDGATPLGRFPLRRALWRPDRMAAPVTGLAVLPLSPDDGWCDDPGHTDYNRPVRLPHPARCETLWREDGVYDVIVVVGHNDDPPVAGLGSAIFMHVARPGRPPTEGCVALDLPDLLALLTLCRSGDSLVVER